MEALALVLFITFPIPPPSPQPISYAVGDHSSPVIHSFPALPTAAALVHHLGIYLQDHDNRIQAGLHPSNPASPSPEEKCLDTSLTISVPCQNPSCKVHGKFHPRPSWQGALWFGPYCLFQFYVLPSPFIPFLLAQMTYHSIPTWLWWPLGQSLCLKYLHIHNTSLSAWYLVSVQNIVEWMNQWISEWVNEWMNNIPRMQRQK